ncbi:GH92 family glycosyl hydrolase [Luteolibacter pohnpeiensis]|uniref:GH92 family glycosyl hydrolase n=1 Tax=Luteolibacter pohnpeiensis TaxID=454153 RepID=A0A934S4T2_9BACT|nr:GH92 family glycosyl hydrolase [Luteolibacter pohnpeiensis]MBK1882551.1 GH92 family glycosyl hydrolase [Luteolibacter pohnpeiensis]
MTPHFRHQLPTGLTASMMLMAMPLASVAADSTSFSSSFESYETPQVFADKAEPATAGRTFQQNVAGKPANSLAEFITKISASDENAPNETAARLADADASSKWLVFKNSGWIQYELSKPGAAATYSLTSANDAPERDPRDWKLMGSNNGSDWTELDAQKDQSWDKRQRGVTKRYTIKSPGNYTFYRLEILSNHSTGTLQLADWDLATQEDPAAKLSPMTTQIGNGPQSGYNIKENMGFTGYKALRYAGRHTAAGEGFATNRLFDVNIPVGKDSRLSYLIFPELTATDLQYPSTHVAVNLKFTDGSELSDLNPLDVYEISATAKGQGTGKILYPNQWNMVRIDIGKFAAGKTISAIQLSYDNPGGTADTAFGGWIDDIKIEAEPAKIDGSSLTHYVDTRRGTNSSGAFSRGSNEVITTIPNGFNFLVPVTNARAQSREYSYQHENNSLNRTPFQGLSISHEPSPWMGDRDQFSLMPVPGGAAPSGDPSVRGTTMDHANETAQPDYYGVKLDSGAMAEMTPTNRGMIMRFTFPGDRGSVVLDSPTGDGEFNIDPKTGIITGWIDKGAGFVVGQSRMFVSGKFDQLPIATGVAEGGYQLTKYAAFDTSENKVVTVRLATSLISLEQAGRNLEMEVGEKSFDDIRAEAQKIWNDRLGVITVEGASETELVTLYSCLYRLNIYPNAQFENVGTEAQPDYRYASPVSPKSGDATATKTNAKIVAGRMYVNNGFWDTYRTTWPAYSLFYPNIAADLIDGFTDQYRDGGWIARWSSPGYANIMTGTSSDVAFADAYIRGVKLKDPLATYDAAVKNASVPSRNQNVGRKGLTTSLFLGFTPKSEHESVSWATEGFINDFGIGNMAAKLAEDPATPESRKATLREESAYYLERAKNYVNLFDPSIGYFQARNADGTWDLSPEEYDPTKWFGPYTETNGWNFGYHAPQDPQGVANLYGGKDKLEARLDAFFSTPETSLGPIHEEVEARDGRFGQWGVSNQVSHHIPYFYNAAGVPGKAQEIVRDALQRSFAGTEIGQGYPGDEDNGEMSAWYIFNALGLYPMQTGTNQLVVGSPLFDKATVHLANGKSLVITTTNNSPSNVYVQSLEVNGSPHSSVTINSDLFTNGGTMNFEMDSKFSDWGTGENDGLPSLTQGTEVAKPLADITGLKGATTSSTASNNVKPLFDDSSATQVRFNVAKPTVTIEFEAATSAPTFYTLTAPGRGESPSAWVLEGSDNGSDWTTLDERKEVSFEYHRQTKPFEISEPKAFRTYRLRITSEGDNVALSEIELLAR